jgi:hypothetical protein
MVMLPPVLPKLKRLSEHFPTEGSVRIELQDDIPVFRASMAVQLRIQDLLSKQENVSLNSEEELELDCYEEMDDYLSFINRTVRNLYLSQQGI